LGVGRACGGREGGGRGVEEGQRVTEGAVVGGPQGGGEQMRGGALGRISNFAGGSVPAPVVASPRSTIGVDWVSNSGQHRGHSELVGRAQGLGPRRRRHGSPDERGRRLAPSRKGQGQGQGAGAGAGHTAGAPGRGGRGRGGAGCRGSGSHGAPAFCGRGLLLWGGWLRCRGRGRGARGATPGRAAGASPAAGRWQPGPVPQGGMLAAQVPEGANGLKPTAQSSPPVQRGR